MIREQKNKCLNWKVGGSNETDLAINSSKLSTESGFPVIILITGTCPAEPLVIGASIAKSVEPSAVKRSVVHDSARVT